MRNRVALTAAKIMLEPNFEADCLSCSYGIRPTRSAQKGLETIRVSFIKGFTQAAEADIRVARAPQGGVISPLLANIYLHAFDREIARINPRVLVRFADDFVIMCRTSGQAESALETARDIPASQGLELHPDKARVVGLREGREGFDLLGCHFRPRVSRRMWERYGKVRYYPHRWPSQRATKRPREIVRDRTGANGGGTGIEWVIENLSPDPAWLGKLLPYRERR